MTTLTAYLRAYERNVLGPLNALQRRANQLRINAYRSSAVMQAEANLTAATIRTATGSLVETSLKHFTELRRSHQASLAAASSARQTANEALRRQADLFKLTVGTFKETALSALETVRPIESILRSVLGEQFNELVENTQRAQDFLKRDVLLTNLKAILDEDETDDNKIAAIDCLLDAMFQYPIAPQRWEFHRSALSNAIRERAEDSGVSTAQAFRAAARQALFIASAELKRPRARAFLRHGKRRFKVENLVAAEDLAFMDLGDYLRMAFSNELMNVLLPDWRDRERKARSQARLTRSLDEIPGGDVEDDRLHIERTDAKLSIGTLLKRARLSSDQEMLLKLMLDEELSATDAARRMGKAESWGRVTFGRITTKLKKIS